MSNRLLRDDLKPEEMQSFAAALNTLIGMEGWALWHACIQEKRNATLGQLAVAPLSEIPRLQGYAEAIQHVLDAPKALLEAFEAGIAATKPEVERPRLRLSPDDSDPAV